jgi:hypothetical protein
MSMRRLICLLTLTLLAVLLLDGLQAAQEFKSELAPGQMTGGPFTPTVVSGKRLNLLRQSIKKELEDQKPPASAEKVAEALKYYEEFPHSPVTEFNNLPVVGIFIREGSEPNVPLTRKLLEKVDEAIARDPNVSLNGFAILVSPDAHSSTTQVEKEPGTLIKQAKRRTALSEKVKQLGKGLKDVVVGYYPPEKLTSWKLNEEPGVTILVYARHRVLANYGFAEGKMTEEDIDRVLKGVEKLMKKQRRPVKGKTP